MTRGEAALLHRARCLPRSAQSRKSSRHNHLKQFGKKYLTTTQSWVFLLLHTRFVGVARFATHVSVVRDGRAGCAREWPPLRLWMDQLKDLRIGATNRFLVLRGGRCAFPGPVPGGDGGTCHPRGRGSRLAKPNSSTTISPTSLPAPTRTP